MPIRKHVLAAAILIASVAPVMAGDDVTLTLGALTSDGHSVTQLVSVKNNAGEPILNLAVECGFLRGTELLATGRGFALNVQTDQTAYLSVAPDQRGVGADHADCRVVIAMTATLAKSMAKNLESALPDHRTPPPKYEPDVIQKLLKQ
jgi:hypothetical protein